MIRPLEVANTHDAMLAACLALTSPALLLPTVPTRPVPVAHSVCTQHRVAPGWMQMQEEAAAPEPPEAATDSGETEGEPAAAAAEPAPAAASDEKQELKDKIAELEKQLVDARGALLAEQAAAKDAGTRSRGPKREAREVRG